MFTDIQSSGCVGDEGVPSLQCIFPLFHNIVTGALMFSGIVALFFIIWAGVQYIRSGGDQKQVEGARKTLTFALVGLVIMLLSFFILNLVSYLTGVDCIREFGFSNCK